MSDREVLDCARAILHLAWSENRDVCIATLRAFLFLTTIVFKLGPALLPASCNITPFQSCNASKEVETNGR